MKHWIAPALSALACAFSLHAQAAVTYHFQSPVYETVDNFTVPCAGGDCKSLSHGARVTGRFTTAEPLPANYPLGEIRHLVTSWSFEDSGGTIAIRHDSPGSRVYRFAVQTDEAGQITISRITVTHWADAGAGPHITGDRFHVLGASTHGPAGGNRGVQLNWRCQTVDTLWGSLEDVPDYCITYADNADLTLSAATYAVGGTWTRAPAPGGGTHAVPTLSEWALLALSTLLAGVVLLRRSLFSRD